MWLLKPMDRFQLYLLSCFLWHQDQDWVTGRNASTHLLYNKPIMTSDQYNAFQWRSAHILGLATPRPPPTCAVWAWWVVWKHKCRNNSKISTNIPTIPPLSRITMSICCLGSHGMEKSYLIFIAFIDSLISAHSPWEWEAGVCVMIWLLLALTLLFVQPLNFYTLPMYIPHVWWQCNYVCD